MSIKSFAIDLAPASRGHLIVFFRKFHRRRLSSWQTTPLPSLPAHFALFSRRSQKVLAITSGENDVRFLRLGGARMFFREHRHQNFFGNWFNPSQRHAIYCNWHLQKFRFYTLNCWNLWSYVIQRWTIKNERYSFLSDL